MVLAGNISRLWRISPRQDAGVSEDRLVCHHPISQPFTTVGVYTVMVCRWTDHILARNPLLEVEADLS
jgi:hypothetical protein